jgi:hypothetical protein
MQELEKTLPSGEECTLSKMDGHTTRWVVDMWAPNGENRWNRVFTSYEDAKREYDRW